MGLPRIRRIFAFCLAIAAALTVATLVTAPATATTQSVVVVGNPGPQSYLDTDLVRLQMTVGGGVAPYTWSATGLTGSKLTIDASSGLISGAFPNPGFYSVTVTARDSVGNTGSATFGISVGRECRHC
jgi:hypothetical protein